MQEEEFENYDGTPTVSAEEEMAKLFKESKQEDLDVPVDDMNELAAPVTIDLDNIDEEAKEAAQLLTERLSGYYFDETYLKKHPYIPQKIATSMDGVRRLMKALSINEKSQDILVKNICKTPNKANMYMAMVSMQNGMLNSQKALNDIIEGLEEIFRKMQDECQKTWTDKEKEEGGDGSMVVRGSRDFIKELQEKLWSKKKEMQEQKNENSSSEQTESQVVSEA